MQIAKCCLLLLLAGVSLPGVSAQGITEQQVAGLHLDWLDRKISPKDNFYAYANGAWQRNHPIPVTYASWNHFYQLQQANMEKFRQMLVAFSHDRSPRPGGMEQKVGDFYWSGMNVTAINRQGIQPLLPLFAQINTLKTSADLQAMIPILHQQGVGVFFSFTSMQDFNNSQEVIGAAFQGGLGLPDRDYYLQRDKKSAAIRHAYVNHIAKMFGLLGDTPAKAMQAAKTVMKLETQLAQVSMSTVAQRDPHAVYHLMDQIMLKKQMPDFSWPDYFAARGLPSLKRINLAMPAFFKALNTQIIKESIHDWKMYLRWHVISSFAAYLSQPFVTENFRMGAKLTGTKKLLPRWQRVIHTENHLLDFALGKLYVEHYFSATQRVMVVEMIQNIRTVFRQTLQTLPWMSQVTRVAAVKKLDLMEDRVGYPAKWRDYSTLAIDRGPYVMNVIRARQFLIHDDLDKIGKPVDEDEWSMAPQEINAYYDPSMNNINIPAGILQPPFFDPHAPAAVNYGAIGSVIGHEMTHGFDDEGAQFDGEGNLKNWWTDSDLKKFREATGCIAKQFSQYKVDGNVPVQGQLVVGEATADLGGVILAYRAFHASKAFKEAKTIAGFTPDQQFFLGAAHAWAGNIRPELARHLAIMDPHPPMIYRVNGTFANVPYFHAAFDLDKMSAMKNQQLCVIW